ncbi:hypothetical protein C8J57DRAFT_1125613 [Mycena rebaudengoi]|nr:hypothetical protein C8J57DRAFT_1125613 [Mycena rebaudengoi]
MSYNYCSMDVEDTAEEETQPHPKRRRLSSPSESSSSRPSDYTNAAGKTFWFSDGDLVLEIEGHLFKVHRKRLLCSVIFSDMLALPQPLDADQVDGCASVVLPGDTIANWQAALAWMYYTECFVNQPCLTFDVISGSLRIATKYEIGALRAWAVAQLVARWPRDVAEMRLDALPHAAEAIALARECHTPQILPSAFYALSVQKFRSNADGGRSHLVLGPADLRRLIAGREALQDELMQILIDPLHEGGCSPLDEDPIHEDGSATLCTHCTPRLESYWRARLAPDTHAPCGTWLVHELVKMLRDNAFCASLSHDGAVCQNAKRCLDSAGMGRDDCVCHHGCVVTHLVLVRLRLRRLCGSIPGFFLL